MTKVQIFFASILFFLLSCSQKNENQTEPINIVAGSSKITGKIIAPDSLKAGGIKVSISVLHPITGDYSTYEIPIDYSGRFALDYDMETSSTIIGLSSNLQTNPLYIKTFINKPTQIEIQYTDKLTIHKIDVTPAMPKYDMMQSEQLFRKLVENKPNDPNWKYPHYYNMRIDDFLESVKKSYNRRLEAVLGNDVALSKEFKDFLKKDFRMFYYTGGMFDYEGSMKINYLNATKDTVNLPKIQKIDRSYFRFLKDFDLNDPQYLHTFTFPELQHHILQNEVLGLPRIGDSDIPSWLKEVKGLLAEQVGFKDGLYYDILAANAYGLQLNEEVKPLTTKQQEAIKNYWGKGEIAKILFRKNRQVIEEDSKKSPLVVHDITHVAKEKLMDTILAKYPGKVVFVDFWATWCGPCLGAMKQFKSIKGDFQGKDVVFVYLTNGSSPKKRWEEVIKGIGSEHYYLKDDQWSYLMSEFGFEYIPSYLLYSKEGILANKFTAFPGNEKVKNLIEDLLTNKEGK